MSEQEVGQVLLQDINSNIAIIQFFILAISGVIAAIGASLAMRASIMLTQAKALVEQAQLIEKTPPITYAQSGHPALIRAAQKSKKNIGKVNRSVFNH